MIFLIFLFNYLKAKCKRLRIWLAVKSLAGCATAMLKLLGTSFAS
jgi:hypothetical protein